MRFLRLLFSRFFAGGRRTESKQLSVVPVPQELIDSLHNMGLKLTIEPERVALILHKDDDIGDRLYVIRYCVDGVEDGYIMQRYIHCISGWEAQLSKRYTLSEIGSFFEKRLELRYQQGELETIPERV